MHTGKHVNEQWQQCVAAAEKAAEKAQTASEIMKESTNQPEEQSALHKDENKASETEDRLSTDVKTPVCWSNDRLAWMYERWQVKIKVSLDLL